ncbi:hypothetical protein SERLA73DRAFT_148973 [Serpula lacrymans var. lacrymans S7.3]|uniref:Tektin n=1 Tax=Serpula lacrymans var. lacrymans (strain S7.3) TaxID=936435 RepID=F8PH98_SERL3|nr:hypothetical protein SERLA73DRAFT_148973 [Serpula lacrymans var. lacrymans S7.3]
MAGLSSCCFLYQAFKLFALAMTDEGPGMHQRESKLWNPCSKVQANINEKVCREPCHKDKQHANHKLPKLPCRNIQKKERNRATKLTAKTLNIIKSHVHNLSKMMGAQQSVDLFCKIEEKLAALRRSFEEVNWDVELIRQLKKEVDGDLVVLEGQLAKMHSNMRIEDHNPLNYDCGYEYERHLDRCNENAQITTFLVVVCSVLVGVARWAGNLLIAMLHLILRMA